MTGRYFVRFALLAAAACASSPKKDSSTTPAAQPTPATAVAFRYLVPVLVDSRFISDRAELFLPQQQLVCSAQEHLSAAEDLWHPRYRANCFAHDGPRNHDRTGERPTERYELPADLVADLAALAELTARQQQLAERVGARLVELVPLDGGHESLALMYELERAAAQGVRASALADIRERAARPGTVTDDQVQRYHYLRVELAALVAARSGPPRTNSSDGEAPR